MPLTKSITTALNEASIAANSRTAMSNPIDIRNSVQCAVTLKVDFPAGILDYTSMLEIYSSYDGITFDTTPINTYSIPLTPNETGRMTIDFPASPMYLGFKVFNAGTHSVSDVIVTVTKQDAT